MKKILIALTTVISATVFAQAESAVPQAPPPSENFQIENIDFDLNDLNKPKFTISDEDDVEDLNEKYRFYQEGDKEREEMFLAKVNDKCDGKIRPKPGKEKQPEQHIREMVGPSLRDLTTKSGQGKVDLGVARIRLEGRLKWCTKF